MDMMKLSLLVIFMSMLVCFLKAFRVEWGVLISVATGLFLALVLFEKVYEVLPFFQTIVNQYASLAPYVRLVLKALGIAYLGEFAVSVCQDTSNHLMEQQITLCAKMAILLLGMPILMTLVSTITGYGS